MEPLGTDLIRDQTKTVSTSLHEETKPICIKAGRAILEEEETSNKFRLHKLSQQESEITQELHNLRLDQENLYGHRISWRRYECRGYRKFEDAQHAIEWELKNVESVKESLYETYEKFDNQIVKLHKGLHHGSIKLVKERQLHKQIEQARGEAEKMSANNLDTREALREYIKDSSSELEYQRTIRMRYRDYYERLQFERAAIEKKITILEGELEKIKLMKVKASKRTTLPLKTQ